MEYIILAATPGIAIQGLLTLFNNSSDETVFISLQSLHDVNSAHTFTSSSTTRIVFHGIYDGELIKHIHTTYPSTKNILLFDTAEAAILQELSNNDEGFSIDSCIDSWANCINQLSRFKEQNPASSALIDYASLTNATAEIISLANKHLDIKLNNCPVSVTNHSSIARLIASAVLIDHDEAMVFYDDAKVLALTSQYDPNYTDTASLIAKQNLNALNEFRTLLKCLKNKNPVENIASTIEIQQSEMEIAQLQIQQLQEELEIAQVKLMQIQQDIKNMSNIRQQLDSKENDLEIALLQVGQLQEELEDTLDKYGFLERPLTNTATLEKLLAEVPLLGLLRNQTNIPI